MTALDDAVLNWKFVNALGGQRAHDELNKLHAMELENEILKKAVDEAEDVILDYESGYHGLCVECGLKIGHNNICTVGKWLKEYGKEIE